MPRRLYTCNRIFGRSRTYERTSVVFGTKTVRIPRAFHSSANSSRKTRTGRHVRGRMVYVWRDRRPNNESRSRGYHYKFADPVFFFYSRTGYKFERDYSGVRISFCFLRKNINEFRAKRWDAEILNKRRILSKHERVRNSPPAHPVDSRG